MGTFRALFTVRKCVFACCSLNTILSASVPLFSSYKNSEKSVTNECFIDSIESVFFE